MLERIEDFVWRDGSRTVIFGAGVLESAAQILSGAGWREFELITTERAVATASPGLREAAAAIHHVQSGGVPEAAAALIDSVHGKQLVALGGGRAIDTAKALASVLGGGVAAIPTTLSGAEVTGIHRLPAGHEAAQLTRPALVIADPEAMTSLPEEGLRATSMNALAHGAEALYGPFANPVASTLGLRGAELIAVGLDELAAGSEARRSLALGSLLCAYAIDSAGLGLHHILGQTIVRVTGAPHAETYAALLPHTMHWMVGRAPKARRDLAAAVGVDLTKLRGRLIGLGGGEHGLAGLGVARDRLPEIVDAVLQRLDSAAMPDRPDRNELLKLIDAAW